VRKPLRPHIGFTFSQVSAIFLSLLGAASICRAAATDDPRTLLTAAIARGDSRVVIPPGIYRLAPDKDAGIVWRIHDVHDVQIVADNVTIVCTKRVRALMLDHCQNVTLSGLTIDYDPLTFTQGKVTAIADDKSWMDIRLDAGYPQVLNDRIVICDPKTRFHKYGINHTWGTKASWSAPSIVRITLKGVANNVDVGDPIAMSGGSEGGAVHGITIEGNSSNVTLKNVTLHCAPGMGIIDTGSDVGMQLLGCKITLGPRPAGATEERLLTTSWDGIQCQPARVGARVEDCVIEHCGDDSWSVTGPNSKGPHPDYRSRGFIYRNNHIYSEGRGALVKVGDGLIEGNDFRGCDKAIIVNPETNSDSVSCDNLIIRNNVIHETGYHQAMPWSDQAGAICLSHGIRMPIVFHNILIEGNTFDSVKGLNLLISSAKDVVVKNNRFVNTHSTDPGRHNGADHNIDAKAVIVVSQSENVSFFGNVIEHMGPFADRAVVIGPGTKDVQGLETGIQVLPGK
jgi:hypothetical protein